MQEKSLKHLKEFNNLLRDVDYSKSTVQKFSDFLSLTAYSIAQPFYKSDKLENKYLDIAKNYTREQHDKFSKMFAIVIDVLEDMQDFLGQVFSTNDMGSAYKGQFFTPYHVSKMMAKISIVDLKEDLANKEFITLSEPCCGSGGMVIAFAEAMKEEGFNYQNRLYVEAVDIDDICFKMAYIQLSLLGIPAKAIKGNILSLKYDEVLFTPLFFINGWYSKLDKLMKTEEHSDKAQEVPQSIEIKEVKREEAIKTVELEGRIQLSLFS